MKVFSISVKLALLLSMLSLNLHSAFGRAGSLDPSFGKNGMVKTNLPSVGGFAASVSALVLQSDDKILAATFGNGGSLLTPFSGELALAYGSLTQSDGKIVVVGEASSRTTEQTAIVMARYLSN